MADPMECPGPAWFASLLCVGHILAVGHGTGSPRNLANIRGRFVRRYDRARNRLRQNDAPENPVVG